MDFREYKLWQKEYLTHNNPFRADCMNPFISMNYLLKDVAFKSRNITQNRLYEKWQDTTNIEFDFDKVVLTKGVRDSLSIIFKLFQDKMIYIPKDVYPRYFELARDNRVKTFRSYPNIEWDSLDRVINSIILFTVPFTPFGREISSYDIEEMLKLCERGNYLILDTVYDYNQAKNFTKLEAIIDTKQCFYLHSLSKTYLSAQILGIVYTPLQYKALLEQPTPTISYNNAYDIVSQIPNLPTSQSKEFNRGWRYLKEKTDLKIKNEIGYFSVINRPFETLLREGVLGVPSSVFGSDNKDLTIITPLFYLSSIYGIDIK